MKIAVIGATGLVGSVMLKVIAERHLDNNEIIAAASPRSVGKQLIVGNKTLTVVSVEEAIAAKPDYAVFSAGAEASRKYAPLFAAQGTTVIDNSSAWRKDANVPLVVPEININAVAQDCHLIANPNCSTVQMVLPLSTLHQRYAIKRLVIATYQSVTGTGMKAIGQLQEEEQQAIEQKHAEGNQAATYSPHPMAYPHPIHRNLFPHGGDFQPDGYTTEEQKLIDETRKILSSPEIRITATVVRVPVVGGHSEAINIEFEHDYDLDEVRSLLSNTPGVVLTDDPANNIYPMPITAQGKDQVYVGRLRRDNSQPNSLNLWISADNLRKGAATNAIEILEELVARRPKAQ